MTMTNRRGTHPILDHVDCREALAEVQALEQAGSPADADYIREVRTAIERYSEYCRPGTLVADAHNLVCYLLDAHNLNTADAAAKTGIADVEKLAHNQRKMTAEDKAALVRAFGLSADAFDQ